MFVTLATGTAVPVAADCNRCRQRVDHLLRADDTFPEPEATISAGRIWSREAVEKWAKENGPIIGEKHPDERISRSGGAGVVRCVTPRHATDSKFPKLVLFEQ